MNAMFSRMAIAASRACGHPITFTLSCLTVIVWALLGPVYGYSDTWQLIINTGTSVVTFLIVVLLQNTQNRDMMALHVKLDELIRVNADARNEIVAAEKLTEVEIEKLRAVPRG